MSEMRSDHSSDSEMPEIVRKRFAILASKGLAGLYFPCREAITDFANVQGKKAAEDFPNNYMKQRECVIENAFTEGAAKMFEVLSTVIAIDDLAEILIALAPKEGKSIE